MARSYSASSTAPSIGSPATPHRRSAGIGSDGFVREIRRPTVRLSPMVIARLPERVRTRAVAEAVVSPSAILLAGAGTAIGIATGLGPLALIAGAAAWAARVAMAVPRRPAGEKIDPFQ